MWLDWLFYCDCGFHSVCPLMEKDKRLMKASWWERLTRGKLSLILMSGAMLSKSLIQLSVDGWGCVPSLLFDLRPNYGGGNGDLLQKVPYRYCCTQCLQPCSRPLLNSMKRQKDTILKDELRRRVGGDQWRNNFRKNEDTEKRKKNTELWMWLVMAVTYDVLKSNTA